jgi:hypothetical protein
MEDVRFADQGLGKGTKTMPVGHGDHWGGYDGTDGAACGGLPLPQAGC